MRSPTAHPFASATSSTTATVPGALSDPSDPAVNSKLVTSPSVAGSTAVTNSSPPRTRIPPARMGEATAISGASCRSSATLGLRGPPTGGGGGGAPGGGGGPPPRNGGPPPPPTNRPAGGGTPNPPKK